MNEEVKELLTSIAIQLGVKIDQVTQAYVKYRMVDSFRCFLIWIVMFGVSVFLLKKSLWFFKLGEDAAEEKYNLDRWDYDWWRFFVVCAAVLLTSVFFIGVMCNTEWITWLVAPEGSFYNIIVNKFA